MLLHRDTDKRMALAEAEAREPPAAAAGLREVSHGAAKTWQFRLAMLRYHRLVYRVAWNIVREAREAEDICQEAFTRLWLHLADVKQIKEWLLRVARNEALSRLRRQHRIEFSDDLESRGESVWQQDSAADNTPDDTLHDQQRAQALRRAVDALPEPQRSLIILFDLEGQDGETCARILELSVNQVKVYLHRARKRLRTQLERAL